MFDNNKDVARVLCKLFRRHDDDVSEARIASILDSMTKSARYDEARAAYDRLCSVWHEPDTKRRLQIEDAIKNNPGWLAKGDAK